MLAAERCSPTRDRVPAALLGVAVAGLLAACGGGRPDPLPDDRPVLQLSRSSVRWEMDAFDLGSLAPADAVLVEIANASAKPDPAGLPTISVEYLDLHDSWIGVAELDRAFWVGIPDPEHGGVAHVMGGGTYRARIAVTWEGAANSPAYVDVELNVRPHPNTWALGRPLVQRYRASHTLTALDDGGAVMAGGRDLSRSPQGEPPAVLGSIERMNPVTGAWSASAFLRRAREEHTATRLSDGRILFAGGRNDAAPLAPPDATWEIYDPDQGRITEEGSLIRGRYGHAAVVLADGRVLLVGGWNREDGGVLGGARSCEIFDPADPVNPVRSVGSLHGDAAESTTAVRLPDGRVLVLNDTPPAPGATVGLEIGAELFDPATETWTRVASRTQPRILNGMAALPDGRALVFGGMYADPVVDPEAPLDGLTYLATSEIYDPTTDQWSPAGSLRAPRLLIRDASVVLPGGEVLLAGGSMNILLGFTPIVEVFDSASETWTVSGSLQTDRTAHAVALLDDGSVLSAGGWPNAAGFPAERWYPRAP